MSGALASIRVRFSRVRALRFPGFDWLRRFLDPLTRVGWATVVTAVLAGGWAGYSGWIEAGTVAVACGVSILIAVIVVMGSRSLEVSLRIPQARTVVGRSIVGEIEVRPAGQGRSRSAVVEMPVGESIAQFFVPSLGSQRQWSEVFAIPARQRGVVVLGPVRTVRADPLGLIRRVKELADPIEVIVHPQTVRVPFDATGFQADIEGVVTAKLSSSDVSFHALRDYIPGDDRRNVHWPTTARTGRLVVRQFEETRRSHHLLLLDNQAQHWTDDDFELAVSAAASMALAGVMAARKVSFATGTEWVTTTSPTRMLDNLARIELSPGRFSLPERVSGALAKRPGVSALTIVTAESVSDEQIAAALSRVAPDVECTVIKVDPQGVPRRSRILGASVMHCPELQDLPRLIATRSRV